MSDLKSRAANAARHVAREASGRLLHREELGWEDELRLAAEYDQERGYGLPLREQSKLAYELSESAPLVRWTPPALRPRR